MTSNDGRLAPTLQRQGHERTAPTMTTAEVSTHNMSTTTASVTINTFTVGGKPITPAGFRQLLSGALIQKDGAFAGLPLGTVNYHEKECQRGGGRHYRLFELERGALRLVS